MDPESANPEKYSSVLRAFSSHPNSFGQRANRPITVVTTRPRARTRRDMIHGSITYAAMEEMAQVYWLAELE